jgi:hypothetical protein
MRHLYLGIVSLLGVAAPTAWAEEPPGDQSPATQLGFYVGVWKESGQSRAGPAQPFGPLTGRETCSWHSGRLAVVCRETTRDQAGSSDSIYILGYDTARSVYTVNGVDNAGTVLSGTGTLHDGVWNWSAEAAAAGTTTPVKYTFILTDKGARKMDVEVAEADGSLTKIESVLYERRH